jgi:hypothetical protein
MTVYPLITNKTIEFSWASVDSLSFVAFSTPTWWKLLKKLVETHECGEPSDSGRRRNNLIHQHQTPAKDWWLQNETEWKCKPSSLSRFGALAFHLSRIFTGAKQLYESANWTCYAQSFRKQVVFLLIVGDHGAFQIFFQCLNLQLLVQDYLAVII